MLECKLEKVLLQSLQEDLRKGSRVLLCRQKLVRLVNNVILIEEPRVDLKIQGSPVSHL